MLLSWITHAFYLCLLLWPQNIYEWILVESPWCPCHEADLFARKITDHPQIVFFAHVQHSHHVLVNFRLLISRPWLRITEPWRTILIDNIRLPNSLLSVRAGSLLIIRLLERVFLRNKRTCQHFLFWLHLVGAVRVSHLILKLDLVFGNDRSVRFDAEKHFSINFIHVNALMHHVSIKICLCRHVLTERNHGPIEGWSVIFVQVRRLGNEERLSLWGLWDPRSIRISSLV